MAAMRCGLPAPNTPFKNLLDGLVGSLAFPGKPAALLNASDRGTPHAPVALREILTTMSAQLLESACATVPLTGAGCEAATIPGNDAYRAKLREVLCALAAAPSAA